MEEKSIFSEIPGGKNKFHSAVLTSFSFNFHHFEYQVLKALKLKWVTNIGVLIDARMLDQSMGQTSAGLKQLSKSYSVNGIFSNGAFHPKITFIIGDNEIIMVFGSGNITVGGHGKNHETFTSLYVDSPDSQLLPLVLEGWQYIEYLARNLEGYSSDRITSVIPNNCSLLTKKKLQKHVFQRIDKATEIAFVYNDETSVLRQISGLMPVNSIKTIKIVSPYYDEDGRFLIKLLNIFPNSDLRVYIVEEYGLPPTKLLKNKRIKFYSWENTERGQKTINGKNKFPRKLHSKLYSFESTAGNYFLIGSMNATIAGFGTMTARGLNQEFGALYKTNKVDYFKELYVSKSIEIKDISRYQRIGDLAPENIVKKEVQNNIRLISCDLVGTSVRIFIKGVLKMSDKAIAFFNDYGNLIAIQNDAIEAGNQWHCAITNDELKNNPAYIVILNSNSQEISNKQPINFLDRLYHTNPSKENRAIRALIGSLEMGKINEFEILNYLNELRPLNRADTNQLSKIKHTSGKEYTPTDYSLHTELTYADAIEAYKNKEVANNILQTHNSVQLWNMISQLFTEKFEHVFNEINDEEETASVTEGATRDSFKYTIRRELNRFAHADKIIRDTNKLVSNYCGSINKIIRSTGNVLNEIGLCQFLLVSHIISVIYHFTEYNLEYESDEPDKKHTGYSPKQWDILSKDNYSRIMCDLLVAFAKLCAQNPIEDFGGTELRKTKFNEYKILVVNNLILYLYLVSKNKIGRELTQTLDLACIQILDKLGIPGENFDDHIKQINHAGLRSKVNFEIINKIKKSRIEDLSSVDKKMIFFRFKNHGTVRITERKTDFVFYKSLFDLSSIGKISIKEFDKL